MSLAKEINEKLDEINFFTTEMQKMEDEIKGDASFKNVMTGETTNKKGAIKVVQAMIDQIKEDINLLSNNGKNVNDIFTNKFYINDHMQDKQIVEEINS